MLAKILERPCQVDEFIFYALAVAGDVEKVLQDYVQVRLAAVG